MGTAWAEYIPRTLATTSLLRSTIRDKGDWPYLEPFVADYEASETSA
jgi:hypothetical protein